MSDRDVSWAVARIVRAIQYGRVNQAYALARALARYAAL